jgi:hypothetical protein
MWLARLAFAVLNVTVRKEKTKSRQETTGVAGLMQEAGSLVHQIKGKSNKAIGPCSSKEVRSNNAAQSSSGHHSNSGRHSSNDQVNRARVMHLHSRADHSRRSKGGKPRELNSLKSVDSHAVRSNNNKEARDHHDHSNNDHRSGHPRKVEKHRHKRRTNKQ